MVLFKSHPKPEWSVDQRRHVNHRNNPYPDVSIKVVTKITNPKGFIHHSDSRIKYCYKEYIKLLKNHKMEIRMAAKADCYENAVAERVNGILKQEY